MHFAHENKAISSKMEIWKEQAEKMKKTLRVQKKTMKTKKKNNL